MSVQPDNTRPSSVEQAGAGRLARHRPPILMRDAEATPLSRLVRPGRSMSTLRRWCDQYGIARQGGGSGRIEVSVVGLTMVEHGDLEALEILRAGNRGHPMVRRYFDLLGLPI